MVARYRYTYIVVYSYVGVFPQAFPFFCFLLLSWLRNIPFEPMCFYSGQSHIREATWKGRKKEMGWDKKENDIKPDPLFPVHQDRVTTQPFDIYARTKNFSWNIRSSVECVLTT